MQLIQSDEAPSEYLWFMEDLSLDFLNAKILNCTGLSNSRNHLYLNSMK